MNDQPVQKEAQKSGSIGSLLNVLKKKMNEAQELVSEIWIEFEPVLQRPIDIEVSVEPHPHSETSSAMADMLVGITRDVEILSSDLRGLIARNDV